MLAAIQKCPSGFALLMLTAWRAAAMPASSAAFRSLLGKPVGAEPVLRAGELPGRLEVLRILGQPVAPDRRGARRALEVLAIAIERVGIVLREGGARDRENRHIQ